MRMEEIGVTVKGISPLLMHRFSDYAQDSVDNSKPKPDVRLTDREDVAKDSAYLEEDGTLYQPGEHFYKMLIAMSSSKRIGKKSAKSYVAGGVSIKEFHIPHKIQKFVVDSRKVKNPATFMANIRHRYRLDDWELSFTILYDADQLTPQFIKELMDEGGYRNGIGDYRPGCVHPGPMGKYIVPRFEVKGTGKSKH